MENTISSLVKNGLSVQTYLLPIATAHQHTPLVFVPAPPGPVTRQRLRNFKVFLQFMNQVFSGANKYKYLYFLNIYFEKHT